MLIRIPPLVVALWALVVPALAQTAAPTRSDEALAARTAKAAAPAPYAPGRVERGLTMFETNPLMQRMFTRRDGLGVRVAGIDDGSPIAAGPSWRASNLAGGRMQAFASAAVAIGTDAEGEAGLTLPQLGTHRLALDVSGTARRLADERFFGTGPAARKADETTFLFNRRDVMARATFSGARWLTLTAGGGAMTTNAGNGHARRVPGISTRFTESDAPGLTTDSTFTVASIGATVDYRDIPRNPRAGGRYHLEMSRYADRDRSPAAHAFTRIDAELEQHLSAWKRQRVLTLRAIASSAWADADDDVPFYLQPTLGGSRLLRGFVTDRFRDSTLVALQAEYGWDVSPFLNAVLFYETGTVAPRWREIDIHEFRRDYGIGFRFGSARTVAVRTDLALGSGEGPRITMRLNHAF